MSNLIHKWRSRKIKKIRKKVSTRKAQIIEYVNFIIK